MKTNARRVAAIRSVQQHEVTGDVRLSPVVRRIKSVRGESMSEIFAVKEDVTRRFSSSPDSFTRNFSERYGIIAQPIKDRNRRLIRRKEN